LQKFICTARLFHEKQQNNIYSTEKKEKML